MTKNCADMAIGCVAKTCDCLIQDIAVNSVHPSSNRVQPNPLLAIEAKPNLLLTDSSSRSFVISMV